MSIRPCTCIFISIIDILMSCDFNCWSYQSHYTKIYIGWLIGLNSCHMILYLDILWWGFLKCGPLIWHYKILMVHVTIYCTFIILYNRNWNWNLSIHEQSTTIPASCTQLIKYLRNFEVISEKTLSCFCIYIAYFYNREHCLVLTMHTNVD